MNNIVKQPMLPDTIHFHHTMNNDNTEVMRITRGGVWVNPDMSIDDTAKAVLAALDSQIKVLIDKAVNEKLDEIATKIEAMPFGDTAASFAVWIREQKT